MVGGISMKSEVLLTEASEKGEKDQDELSNKCAGMALPRIAVVSLLN